MLWLFIVGFLCGIYELLIGVIGIGFINSKDFGGLFGITCINGIYGNTVWGDPTKPLGEIF